MPEGEGKKPPQIAEKHPQIAESGFRAFFAKLRKRRIIETLAAFIGGGWLLVEVVERLLVGHYEFPKESIDMTVVSVIGALLSILVWRWFGGTEKRMGNIKVEVLLVPLIILTTLAVDLIILLEILGILGKTLLIAAVAVCLGIAWIILKSLQWAAAPVSSAGLIQKYAEPSSPPSGPPEKSIVVLPFVNISPEEGQEYFCDGMTEEIITDLSHVHDLLVISRSSAMTFKGTKKTIPEIAGAVNVRYILEGSIRKAGNSLRITAQLIDSATDAHLWAERYSGTLDDIFDIQEKVSRSIVEALRLKLTPDEKQKIADRPINNPLAYEYYFKARQEILKLTEEGINRALQHLQHGLDIVGENALLFAGMGYAYYQYVNAGLKNDASYIIKAEQCVKRVFDLDPDSPYGHLVLGLLRIWWKDSREGIRHLKRVLVVNPDDFDALYWLSSVYAMIGKKEAAEPLTERLMKIDPLNPAVYFYPGWIQWWDGHFSSALESFQKSYQTFPDDFLARLGYIMTLLLNHHFDKAWLILGQLAKEMPGYPLVEIWLKFKFALEGEKPEVLHWKSSELKNWAWRDFAISYYVAQCYSLIDEKKGALDWLEHSIDLGMINYPFMNEHDPFFENIRGEERFKKLMERVKKEWEEFEV